MPLEISEEELMQWELMLKGSPDTCVSKRELFSLPYGKRQCEWCGHEWNVWKVSDWDKYQKCPQCNELHDLSGIPIFPRALDLAHMHYGLVTASSMEGGGKSMFTTAIGYREKEYYRRRVCCNRPKKPAYGQHEIVTSEDFIKELKTLSKLTDEYNADAKKGKVWTEEETYLRFSQESKIYGSVYDNDEFHLVMHMARRTKESRYWGDFGKQWRHYHILAIAQTPNAEELDKNLWQNRLTHDVVCYRTDDAAGWSVAKVYNRRMRMVVSELSLEHAKWGKLFYTYSPPDVHREQDIKITGKIEDSIITIKTDMQIIEAIREKTKDANSNAKEILYSRLTEKSRGELLKIYKEIKVIESGEFKGDIAFSSRGWK
jgi:hypothetical protein